MCEWRSVRLMRAFQYVFRFRLVFQSARLGKFQTCSHIVHYHSKPLPLTANVTIWTARVTATRLTTYVKIIPENIVSIIHCDLWVITSSCYYWVHRNTSESVEKIRDSRFTQGCTNILLLYLYEPFNWIKTIRESLLAKCWSTIRVQVHAPSLTRIRQNTSLDRFKPEEDANRQFSRGSGQRYFREVSRIVNTL